MKIVYHRDEGAWWADSPDMPGFSAVGDTFDGTRKLALEGIPFYFDGNRPDIVDERMENGARLTPTPATTRIPRNPPTHPRGIRTRGMRDAYPGA